MQNQHGKDINTIKISTTTSRKGYGMPGLKKIPVGIEDFREIRTRDAYYIDKTRLIEQLIENWSKVNLFTRPRRFGKTLNMSMLKTFF